MVKEPLEQLKSHINCYVKKWSKLYLDGLNIFDRIVIVICLPTRHQGVLTNSLKNVRAFQIELEFGSVGVWGEEKTGVPGEKLLGARERTNNKLNPHGIDAGI